MHSEHLGEWLELPKALSSHRQPLISIKAKPTLLQTERGACSLGGNFEENSSELPDKTSPEKATSGLVFCGKMFPECLTVAEQAQPLPGRPGSKLSLYPAV